MDERFLVEITEPGLGLERLRVDVESVYDRLS